MDFEGWFPRAYGMLFSYSRNCDKSSKHTHNPNPIKKQDGKWANHGRKDRTKGRMNKRLKNRMKRKGKK